MQNIVGEIYQVDEKMLSHLDWFEDCPQWYQRQKISVTKVTSSVSEENATDNDPTANGMKSTNDKIECWIFMLENFRDDLLEREYFSDYIDAAKIHGYEKEMEETDEARLESSIKATLK